MSTSTESTLPRRFSHLTVLLTSRVILLILKVAERQSSNGQHNETSDEAIQANACVVASRLARLDLLEISTLDARGTRGSP